MAQYGGKAIIPLKDVCADYFSHLTPQKFRWKADRGEIKIPVVRIEGSQKAAVGIHLNDLAAWIDARKAAADKEFRALNS